jgi:ammonium transporter, Amt family
VSRSEVGCAGGLTWGPDPALQRRRHARLTVVVTYILLKLVGLFVPIRVSMQQELEGLDTSQHGEALQ